MSDNPVAALLAAVVVVPLCLVCVGPAAFVAAAAWLAGWLAGMSPMGTAGLALFIGLGVYALFRRWGESSREREAGDAP